MLLQSEDMSYDPCQDFYSFACGGYIRKMPIGTEVLYSQEEANIQQLRDFLESTDSHNVTEAVGKAIEIYKQCRHPVGNAEKVTLEDTKDLLKELGGWPLAMKKAEWQDKKDDDFISFLADVMRRGFDTELLGVDLMPDLRNSSITTITLDQPDSVTNALRETAPRRRRQAQVPAVLTTEDNDDKEKYRKAITKMAKLLGNSDEESINADINDMFQLKKALREIASTADQRTNYTKMYKAFSIWELHRSTNTLETKFNWILLLQKLFSDITRISEDTDIIMLLDVEFLKKFPALYRHTSQRTLTNYVIYEGVLSSLPALFTTELTTDTEVERWSKCVTMTEELMPLALIRFFVDNLNFNVNKTVEEAEDITNKIQEAYKDTFSDNSWLESETKEKATRKAEGLKKFVGYPDWIFDNMKLNTHYNYAAKASSPLQTYLTMKKKAALKDLENYRNPVHKDRWPTDPLAARIQYGPLLNSVWIPIGLLKPPHFERNYLAAMNYGGVGSLIGREISLGFDETGRQFDENGNLQNWWSHKSQGDYVNRTHCFISQYSNYCEQHFQTNVRNNKTGEGCMNGASTLRTNIADNIGVRTSYKAYQKWIEKHGSETRLPGLMDFSPNQIFFISYAQMWCENYPSLQKKNIPTDVNHIPGRYRVNGALANFADFSKAFRCSAGPMNREDQRCSLW